MTCGCLHMLSRGPNDLLQIFTKITQKLLNASQLLYTPPSRSDPSKTLLRSQRRPYLTGQKGDTLHTILDDRGVELSEVKLSACWCIRSNDSMSIIQLPLFHPTMNQPPMPLDTVPSTLSSKWSLDSNDYNPPRKPLRSYLPNLRLKTARRSYPLGDPIFHRQSLIPYTFEGFTGNKTTNEAGETGYEARFRRHPVYAPPYQDSLVNLYHSFEAPKANKGRPSFLKRCGEALIAWACGCTR